MPRALWMLNTRVKRLTSLGGWNITPTQQFPSLFLQILRQCHTWSGSSSFNISKQKGWWQNEKKKKEKGRESKLRSVTTEAAATVADQRAVSGQFFLRSRSDIFPSRLCSLRSWANVPQTQDREAWRASRRVCFDPAPKGSRWPWRATNWGRTEPRAVRFPSPSSRTASAATAPVTLPGNKAQQTRAKPGFHCPSVCLSCPPSTEQHTQDRNRYHQEITVVVKVCSLSPKFPPHS